MGGSNIQGRLASFVGGAGQVAGEKPADKKAEKKQFSLGLGETQMAARVDKAVAQGTFGKNVQRKLAQADLKLTLFEFMLAKVSMTIAGAAVGLFIGRGGPVETVVFGLAGIAVGFFAPGPVREVPNIQAPEGIRGSAKRHAVLACELTSFGIFHAAVDRPGCA